MGAIASLPSKPLEELAIGFAKLRRIALFDFESLRDLETWLTATKLSLLLDQLTERLGEVDEGVRLASPSSEGSRLEGLELRSLLELPVEGIEALGEQLELGTQNSELGTLGSD